MNYQIKLTYCLILAFVITISGCKSKSSNKQSDPEVTVSLNCQPVGLGDTHPDASLYQNILDEYIGHGFPGITAAVYTPSKGLWVGASGYTDVQNKEAMQPCHTFFSGSVAKLYTVTAAMTLQENQTLNLDDPIAWHLPADVANNLPNAQLVSIRQLMNHTSGIPDHDNDDALNSYVDSHDGHLPTAEGQLAYLYDDAPLFAPGESAEYSSANTVALSLVIDAIAGEHHSNIISDAIIERTNLTETFYKNEPNYPNVLNLVQGYVGPTPSATKITDIAVNYCGDSQGDAGLIASANDYFAFMKNLMEGQIVLPSTLDLMQDEELVGEFGPFKLGFGLGLFLISLDDELVKIGHSGATVGGMSHVYFYPPTQSYIVLLTNTIIDGNASLLELWGSGLLVGDGSKSIMSDIETLILNP